MKFLIRLLITAAALWAAVALVPGIEHAGPWVNLLGVALVFGIVNAVIRPILLVLTCPIVLLTLGLFIFVLNGLLFWAVGTWLEGFNVGGFWAGVLGAILFSIVSWLLSALVQSAPTR